MSNVRNTDTVTVTHQIGCVVTHLHFILIAIIFNL